jgi:hypothetical protein
VSGNVLADATTSPSWSGSAARTGPLAYYKPVRVSGARDFPEARWGARVAAYAISAEVAGMWSPRTVLREGPRTGEGRSSGWVGGPGGGAGAPPAREVRGVAGGRAISAGGGVCRRRFPQGGGRTRERGRPVVVIHVDSDALRSCRRLRRGRSSTPTATGSHLPPRGTAPCAASTTGVSLHEDAKRAHRAAGASPSSPCRGRSIGAHLPGARLARGRLRIVPG